MVHFRPGHPLALKILLMSAHYTGPLVEGPLCLCWASVDDFKSSDCDHNRRLEMLSVFQIGFYG